MRRIVNSESPAPAGPPVADAWEKKGQATFLNDTPYPFILHL
jgi:hypothetical protein